MSVTRRPLLGESLPPRPSCDKQERLLMDKNKSSSKQSRRISFIATTIEYTNGRTRRFVIECRSKNGRAEIEISYPRGIEVEAKVDEARRSVFVREKA